MAAPLSTCVTIEQRGVVRYLWAKKYGSKGYPQRNAAHMVTLFYRGTCIQGRHHLVTAATSVVMHIPIVVSQ
jgi:hypothetical protein